VGKWVPLCCTVGVEYSSECVQFEFNDLNNILNSERVDECLGALWGGGSAPKALTPIFTYEFINKTFKKINFLQFFSIINI